MTRTGNTGKVVTNVVGVFHNNFFKIGYNHKMINKSFLYNLLLTHQIQKEILIRAGNSTIPDLNHTDFYGINVNIPNNIEEQNNIGLLIDKSNNLIASNQHNPNPTKFYQCHHEFYSYKYYLIYQCLRIIKVNCSIL